MKRGIVRVGDRVEFFFPRDWQRPTLEMGVVIGCHAHKVSIVAELKDRAVKKLVKWGAIQRVVDKADINELLTHSHGRMRKLGRRLLRKQERALHV